MMKLDGMLFNKYEDMDVSVYATTETIDEFIDLFDIELIDMDYDECLDLIDEEEYLLLSRNFDRYGNDYWILEPVFHDGVQYVNDGCTVMLVEKGVEDLIDFDKVYCKTVDFFEDVITYAGEEDEMTDWIDDVIEDFLYELNNLEEGESYYDCIRKYFEALISVTVDEVVEETVNEIFKMLGYEVN